MTVRWTVRAAEPTEQGCARGETAAPTIIHCASACKQKYAPHTSVKNQKKRCKKHPFFYTLFWFLYQCLSLLSHFVASRVPMLWKSCTISTRMITAIYIIRYL